MRAELGQRLRIVTIAAAAALLPAAAALGQSASPGAPSGAPGAPPLAAQPAPRPAAPAVNPLTSEDVSKITGAAVYGSDDKKIGTISTVLMRPATKTVDRLVVGAGGMLGIGTHYVALPVDAFSWDSQAGAFKLTKTAEDLKAMPEWHEQVGAMPESSDPATQAPRSGAGSSSPATSPTDLEQRVPAPDEGRT